jgi:septal ring factor EnvC (AmiA/AmiB activator)
VTVRGVPVGLVLLSLAVLLGLAASGDAAGRSPAETIRQKREALGEMRRQLDEARARASAARTREHSLLSELEDMDRTLVKKRAEIHRLDQRIRQVEAQLAALGGRRGKVAEDIVALRGAVAARLRFLERLRHLPGPPGWLGGDAERRRVLTVADLGRVAEVELGQLADFTDAAEQLRLRQAEAARGRQELVSLRRAVESERAALNTEAERRRSLLAQVRDDRATSERMAAELEEASRRLEALVRELGRRAQARTRPAAVRRPEPARPQEGTPSRAPSVGLGALRGQLPWPLDGRIVAGFGRQVHPRFGTETFRTGVDIDADEGALIRAVYAGVVLYRGWLKGYGNLVILDHGDGFYTLYGHASEVLVTEGERVRGGQGIARVGETGSLVGPRLYFEVRYQGRAEDPREWLRERS